MSTAPPRPTGARLPPGGPVRTRPRPPCRAGPPAGAYWRGWPEVRADLRSSAARWCSRWPWPACRPAWSGGAGAPRGLPDHRRRARSRSGRPVGGAARRRRRRLRAGARRRRAARRRRRLAPPPAPGRRDRASRSRSVRCATGGGRLAARRAARAPDRRRRELADVGRTRHHVARRSDRRRRCRSPRSWRSWPTWSPCCTPTTTTWRGPSDADRRPPSRPAPRDDGRWSTSRRRAGRAGLS